MKHFTLRQKIMVISALAFNPLAGAAIDIYVPSMTSIAHYFQTDRQTIQLTIAAYMLGFGIFQFFSGILSDRFGRRPLMTIGLILMIGFSLLAAFAPTESILLVARFLQGLAMATVASACRAVFTDLYEGKAYQKIALYFNLLWSLGPILAPFIGGYLQHFFGWRAPLCFLALYAFIVLVPHVYTVESIQQKHSLHPKVWGGNIKTIVSHRLFWVYTTVVMMVYGAIITFNTVGPFLIQGTLHYSPIVFGRIGLAIGIAMFLGTTLARMLIRFSQDQRLLIGLTIATVGIIGMLFWQVFFPPMSLWSISIPMWFIILGCGTSFPCAYAGGLSLFPKMGGTCGALLGTFMVVGTSLIGAASALLHTQTALPLALAFLGLFAVCWIVMVGCFAIKPKE